MTQMPCSAAQRPTSSTNPRGATAPVGLDGEHHSSALVFGVRAASRASTVGRNSVDSSNAISTGTPPARRTASG